MKLSKHLLLIGLTLLLGAHQVSAQLDISGSWACECVVEEIGTTLRFNDLCDYEIKGAQLRLIPPELTISDEFIEIQSEKQRERVPYSYDQDKDILTFNYKDLELKYTVYKVTSNTQMILRGEDSTYVKWERK